MSDGNYIKLHRSILDWEWYSNMKISRLFIHMLLKANWKEGKFQGITIPRGSFVSSVPKLELETGLTEDEIRTAIKKLVKSGAITRQTTNKNSIFTIVNYDLYQGTSQSNPNQIPDKSQSVPSQIPTIEEKKEVKKNNNTLCNADADALFERLWKIYPHKRGKGQVSDANKRHLLDIGFEELERAVNRYKADLAENSWRKPQNGSTFFNGGYVDYMDANYEPVSMKKTEKQSANRFNAFPQREYSEEDYAEIEKRMIQRR